MIFHVGRKSGHHLFTLSYLLICFIISLPFNYATSRLLYTVDGVPAGQDAAYHTYAILEILDTGNPLLPYSQFPSNPTDRNYTDYYPSFLHLTISVITRLVGLNQAATDPAFVISIETSFMFCVSLAGTAGYAIFIRSLLYKLIVTKIGTEPNLLLCRPRYELLHLSVSVLSFSVFIFSVIPIVQYYNDGTYGELFAMWLIFPYYLYLLINRHWILSAILLAAIASSHNLSLLMSLSATISYLISLALQEFRYIWKNLVKFIAVFFVCATPAFIFFYSSSVASYLTEGISEDAPPGLVEPWPMTIVIQQISPVLFYGGITCLFLVGILNYRILAWLSGWGGIYFVVINSSSLLGARFARELSIIFGMIIGVCVAYVLFMSFAAGREWFKSIRSLTLKKPELGSREFVVAVIICAIIIPLWYLYFHNNFQYNSNPLRVKYFSNTIDESNRFFLASTGDKDRKGTIVQFGGNPWLPVTAFEKFDVLRVQPSQVESSIEGGTAGGDRSINMELYEIFRSPYIAPTACVLKKYDVDFVSVSMHNLPERYYTPEHGIVYRQLDAFQSFSSPFLQLEKEFVGQYQEYLRIYSVNKSNVSTACNKAS